MVRCTTRMTCTSGVILTNQIALAKTKMTQTSLQTVLRSLPMRCWRSVFQTRPTRKQLRPARRVLRI